MLVMAMLTGVTARLFKTIGGAVKAIRGVRKSSRTCVLAEPAETWVRSSTTAVLLRFRQPVIVAATADVNCWPG